MRGLSATRGMLQGWGEVQDVQRDDPVRDALGTEGVPGNAVLQGTGQAAAKNAEMKQAHGLGKADSRGLAAIRLQSYFTAFVVNVKRIVRLAEPGTA